MICPKCKKAIKDGCKFCTECGEKIVIPEEKAEPTVNETQLPEPEAPKAEENSQATEKADGNTDESADTIPEENPAPKDEQKKSIFAKAMEKYRPGIGAGLMLSFFCLDCLPFILKGLKFLSVKASLGAFSLCLYDLIGVILASAFLFTASREKGSFNRASSSLLFVGLFTGARTLGSIAASKITAGSFGSTYLFVIAAALIDMIFAVWMLNPLKRIVSERENVKQRGRFIPTLLIFLSLMCPDAVGLAIVYIPFEIEPSVMSKCAEYLLLSLLEAGLIYLAAKRLLKKQTERDGARAHGKRLVPLIVGLALIVGVFVIGLDSAKVPSLGEAVSEDIAYYMTEGELLFGAGDFVNAGKAYDRAAEHAAAWNALMNDEGYSPDRKYRGDTTLEYLGLLDESKEEVRDYLITSYNEDELYMFFPLMESFYDEERMSDDGISEESASHENELVMACIATERFSFFSPTREDLVALKEDLAGDIAFTDSLGGRIKVLKAFADAQKGDIGTGRFADILLEAAEESPDDISLQYMASYVGSENTYDNASHYDKTVEAIGRLHKLWNEKYSSGASDDEKYTECTMIAGMMMNMKRYADALPPLEEALGYRPDSISTMQNLSVCYLESESYGKVYELSRDILKEKDGDLISLRNLCVSALKTEKPLEAIDAASKLADIVKSYDGEGESDGDALLFNCVQYLGMTASTQWTDYDYIVYDINMDEETEKAFRKNDFLYNYVSAIYYAKEHKDNALALEYSEKALAYQNKSSRLWYLRGLTLLNDDRYEEARDAYTKANEITPDDPSVLFALATTYDALGEYRTAYELCIQAKNQFPNGVDHANDWFGVSYHIDSLIFSLKNELEKGE